MSELAGTAGVERGPRTVTDYGLEHGSAVTEFSLEFPYWEAWKSRRGCFFYDSERDLAHGR